MEGKVIPCAPQGGRRGISVERSTLPLTIQYEQNTYVLVLTRGNKLLLQKPIQ